MSDPENVVRVPRPSPASFNPDRPLSGNTLLQAQVRHFHALDQQLPADQRTGIPLTEIQTEGQAAAYIRRITALVHPHATRRERVRKAT